MEEVGFTMFQVRSKSFVPRKANDLQFEQREYILPSMINLPSFVTIIKPDVATSRRPTVNKRGFGSPG